MAQSDEKQNSKPKKWNWSKDVVEVGQATGIFVLNHQGFLYPPITRKASLQWLLENFCPSPQDVFIATYPKCGTTWMQKICVEIMREVMERTKKEKLDIAHDAAYLNIDCSNLYLDGKFSSIYYLESMINNDPHYFQSYLYCTNKLSKQYSTFLRFWKTHSFFDAFPSTNAHLNKYIVVIRDCKDVAVSYYHYLKLIAGDEVFKCDFEKWIDIFTAGVVPGGNVVIR